MLGIPDQITCRVNNSEKWTSTWLSQLAWTGRCTRIALGYARLILFTEASPRCDEQGDCAILGNLR
jgi:hypothetical protein